MKTVQTKFVYKRPNKKVKPQIESLLNQKRIDFSKESIMEEVGEWNRNAMDEVCPLLKEWKVEILLFSK